MNIEDNKALNMRKSVNINIDSIEPMKELYQIEQTNSRSSEL